MSSFSQFSGKVEARWSSGKHVGLSKVDGSSLVSAVGLFSLDNKLCSTLSLSAQVYKWVPAR